MHREQFRDCDRRETENKRTRNKSNQAERTPKNMPNPKSKSHGLNQAKAQQKAAMKKEEEEAGQEEAPSVRKIGGLLPSVSVFVYLRACVCVSVYFSASHSNSSLFLTLSVHICLSVHFSVFRYSYSLPPSLLSISPCFLICLPFCLLYLSVHLFPPVDKM